MQLPVKVEDADNIAEWLAAKQRKKEAADEATKEVQVLFCLSMYLFLWMCLICVLCLCINVFLTLRVYRRRSFQSCRLRSCCGRPERRRSVARAVRVCMTSSHCPQTLEGWISPVTNSKTTAKQSRRFKTFPKVQLLLSYFQHICVR